MPMEEIVVVGRWIDRGLHRGLSDVETRIKRTHTWTRGLTMVTSQHARVIDIVANRIAKMTGKTHLQVAAELSGIKTKKGLVDELYYWFRGMRNAIRIQGKALGYTKEEIARMSARYNLTKKEIASWGSRNMILNKTFKITEKTRKGMMRFRMELLSVMFFGAMLQRTFFGLLKPALDLVGAFEIFSLILAIVFLPIALYILKHIAIPLLAWTTGWSEKTKMLTGSIVLLLGIIGAGMFLFGTLGLGFLGLNAATRGWKIALTGTGAKLLAFGLVVAYIAFWIVMIWKNSMEAIKMRQKADLAAMSRDWASYRTLVIGENISLVLGIKRTFMEIYDVAESTFLKLAYVIVRSLGWIAERVDPSLGKGFRDTLRSIEEMQATHKERMARAYESIRLTAIKEMVKMGVPLVDIMDAYNLSSREAFTAAIPYMKAGGATLGEISTAHLKYLAVLDEAGDKTWYWKGSVDATRKAMATGFKPALTSMVNETGIFETTVDDSASSLSGLRETFIGMQDPMNITREDIEDVTGELGTGELAWEDYAKTGGIELEGLSGDVVGFEDTFGTMTTSVEDDTVSQVDSLNKVKTAIIENTSAVLTYTDMLNRIPTEITTSIYRYEYTYIYRIFRTLFRLLQRGGIVTRPTLAMIGEAGPEAVIPLKGREKALGATTIVYNDYRTINMTNEIRDEVDTEMVKRVISEDIVKEINAMLRR